MLCEDAHRAVLQAAAFAALSRDSRLSPVLRD